MFAFCLRKRFPLLLHEIETSIVYSQNGNVLDLDQSTQTFQSQVTASFVCKIEKFEQLHVYE